LISKVSAKYAFSELATKEDLQQLYESLTKDLTIRVGVMLAAAVGMIVGILRLPV
jgi:hypothetical protein